MKYLLCQTIEFTQQIMKEMKKNPQSILMKFMNISITTSIKKENEDEKEIYVLIIDDVERSLSIQQLKELEFIRNLYVRKNITFHIILTTFQSQYTCFTSHYRYITFQQLTIDQLITICFHSLPKEMNETYEYWIKQLLIELYKYNPSRLYCITSSFNFLEILQSSESFTQNDFLTIVNSFKQPLLFGRKHQDQHEDYYHQSYHLNYLILSAHKLVHKSKDSEKKVRKTKSFSLQIVYTQYKEDCPNPLTYDMFILLFKSALNNNYFEGAKANVPFLVNLYCLTLSDEQCEEINKIVYGEQQQLPFDDYY